MKEDMEAELEQLKEQFEERRLNGIESIMKKYT